LIGLFLELESGLIELPGLFATREAPLWNRETSPDSEANEDVRVGLDDVLDSFPLRVATQKL
jgi:hypothetical protein